jgi:hypothetical protein
MKLRLSRFGRPVPEAAAEPAAAAAEPSAAVVSAGRRAPRARIAARIVLHAGFLVASVCLLVAYEHFRIGGHASASVVCLVLGAGFGFAPARDVVRVVFGVEGKVLHFVHGVGGLALAVLPVAGVVSGGPVLSDAARAPFALMAAAQAVMHQQHPRNARQAAALRRFAASLPEVAQFTRSKNLASPANVARAVAALSDILTKAQALGETELEADPGFQSALRRVSARFGVGLELDAVDLALAKLAANPAAAGAMAGLRRQLASARRANGQRGGR